MVCVTFADAAVPMMTRARVRLFKSIKDDAVRGDAELVLEEMQDGSDQAEDAAARPPAATRSRRGRKRKDEANAFFQQLSAGRVRAAQTSTTELPLLQDVGVDCDYWERIVPVNEALCGFAVSFTHVLTKVPRIRHGGMIGQLLCVCTEPVFVFIPAAGRDAFVAALDELRGAPLRTMEVGKISLFSVTFRIATIQLVTALQAAGIRYILLCEYGMQARPLGSALQMFASLSEKMDAGDAVLQGGTPGSSVPVTRVVHLDLSRNVLPTSNTQVDVFRFVRATDQAEIDKITWSLV
jgi:hypothetical protein